MTLNIYNNKEIIVSLGNRDQILAVLGNVIDNSRWKIEPTDRYKLKYVYNVLDDNNTFYIAGVLLHCNEKMFLIIKVQ